MVRNQYNWTFDKVRNLAKTCRSRTQFAKLHRSAYEWSRRKGLLEELFGEPIRGKWTLESARAEAQKFQSRTEFFRNSNAYQWAYRRDLLDEICAHMEPKRKSWDRERVLEAMEQCEKRTEFRDKYPGAYQWAITDGSLQEMFEEVGIDDARYL